MDKPARIEWMRTGELALGHVGEIPNEPRSIDDATLHCW